MPRLRFALKNMEASLCCAMEMGMVRTILLVVAGGLVAGCANQRATGLFRRAHPDCDGEVSITQRPGREVFDVRGCGISDTVHRTCYDGQCHVEIGADALERAAFDLECPRERLTSTVVGDALGVSGCGRRAVYVATFDGWVMNNQGASRR